MARKCLMLLKKRSTMVALAIEREVALARRLAICPRRNDRLDAADFEMLDEAVAIIAFVDEEGCGFDFLGQDLGLRYVVNVSAGEAHRQRTLPSASTMA